MTADQLYAVYALACLTEDRSEDEQEALRAVWAFIRTLEDASATTVTVGLVGPQNAAQGVPAWRQRG